MDGEDLIGPTESSFILKRSPQAVVYYARKGLLPHIRTARGNRLFRRRDVEKFALQLSDRKVERAAT